MSDFLAELFERFDPSQQARIRAAEASAEQVYWQGHAAVRHRMRLVGLGGNRDLLLQPLDEARAEAAGVVFIAYINALWEGTDKARTERINAFLADVDRLIAPILEKYGHWEGKDTLAQLRAECEKDAWIGHSRFLAGTGDTGRVGSEPARGRLATPEICFVRWGPIPEDHPVGLRVGQGGFYLENDGISAHEVSIELFSVGRSMNASGEPVSRIPERGKGFLLVWLSVAKGTSSLPVASMWALPAAFMKATEEDPAIAARGQGYAVKVAAKYRDSANTWYRSSANLSYIPAQGRIAFGPTVHERVDTNPADASRHRSTEVGQGAASPVDDEPVPTTGTVSTEMKADGPQGGVPCDTRLQDGKNPRPGVHAPELSQNARDLFADENDRRPLGDNCFLPDHPGYLVFEEANWKAEELIGQLKSKLFETCAKITSGEPAELVQHCLTYQLRYIEIIVEQGLLIVVNQETERGYEEWLNDFVRFRFKQILAWAGRTPVGFPHGLLPYINIEGLQLLMMTTVELYKSKAASRVLQNLHRVPAKPTAESTPPPVGDGEGSEIKEGATSSEERGDDLERKKSERITGERVFRITGDFWTLVFDSSQPIHVKKSKGMQYIAYLLQCPNQPRSCIQLVAAAKGEKDIPALGVGDKILDSAAIATYTKQKDDLEFQLDEAERNCDQGRKEALQEQLQKFDEELERAVGLGGRHRRLSDDAERLRKGVSNSITRAIEAIGKHDSALAEHLDRYVDLGFSVCYRSDGVEWEL